jgi:hypothetical protein
VKPLIDRPKQNPEERLAELGLVLPAPFPLPPGVIPISWVRIAGTRVITAGHGPQAEDGQLAQPLGKVGTDLTVDQGVEAARLTALSMLGSLQRELGSLNRIKRWVRVFAMVNAAPDFVQHTPVINGFSDQIADIFGFECASAARCAVGMSSLPMGMPVEIEAELELFE